MTISVARRALLLVGLAIGLSSAAGLSQTGMTQAAAAEAFPTKPITLIVPYRAGGGTDTMSRVLVKALKDELGQPVVVVNRKGGGGAVGATFLKNAAPDGYTILMGGDDIPTWMPLAQDVDFTGKDFRYLAAVADYQNAIITTAEQPYKTFEEMVAYAKENPGLAVADQGSITTMFFSILREKEGLDLKVIPTGGGAEVVQLMLGGKVDVAYSGGIHSAYPDELIVLASLNKARLAGAPDAPTFEELGYGLSMPSYIAFMAPAAVPDEIAAKLEAAILKASQSDDFRKIVEQRLQSPVLSVGSAELTAHIESLTEQFKVMEKK